METEINSWRHVLNGGYKQCWSEIYEKGAVSLKKFSVIISQMDSIGRVAHSGCIADELHLGVLVSDIIQTNSFYYAHSNSRYW